MKRIPLVVLALSFLLFSGLKPIGTLPIGIAIHVAPSVLDPYQLLERQTPYTYTCRAFIYDASEKRIGYAIPELIVAPGKRETTTVKGALFDVTFTAAVSEKRDRAKTEVVIMRGDRILHRQKSDVVMHPSAVKRF